MNLQQKSEWAPPLERAAGRNALILQNSCAGILVWGVGQGRGEGALLLLQPIHRTPAGGS